MFHVVVFSFIPGPICVFWWTLDSYIHGLLVPGFIIRRFLNTWERIDS